MTEKFNQLNEIINILSTLPFLFKNDEGLNVILVRTVDIINVIKVNEKGTDRAQFTFSKDSEENCANFDKVFKELNITINEVDLESVVKASLARELRFTSSNALSDSIKEMSRVYQEAYRNIIKCVFQRLNIVW